jgi:hypothetical protein
LWSSIRRDWSPLLLFFHFEVPLLVYATRSYGARVP